MQFFDVRFRMSGTEKLRRSFWEYTRDGEERTYLMCLDFDQELNRFINRRTGQPAVDERTGKAVQPAYELTAAKALEVYLGTWLPLPIFRADQASNDGEGGFAKGPANWARGYVEPLATPDEDGNTHTLVLAFDTRLEPLRAPEQYHALEPKDEAAGAEFALAHHENDNGWFLNLRWVEDWAEDLFLSFSKSQALAKGRKFREEDLPFACEHLARFLTFLELLRQLALVPRIKVVNTSRSPSIHVDLILDVGNSRTCGMLVETRPDQATRLTDSYVLELRNLTHPAQRYREPFDSRLEFSLARFGDPQRFSRNSGRRTEAFGWPTVVRVGPEAAQLGVLSRAAEGRTGMSSPKRYLWDERARTQQWRLNSGTDDPDVREEPVVRGAYVLHVNNQGIPIDKADDPAFPDALPDPVTEPLFSRSSLMMFMLSEILAHALVTINSPENRSNQAQPDVPRRLAKIILTMPPAMPIAERKIFLRWARWAVDVLWSALGWDTVDSSGGAHEDYRVKPTVQGDVDEASATQLVYLYNEVVDRFRGDVAAFFRLLGRHRDGYGKEPSLRVASIDVGGGTTDLIVTTYQREGSGAAAVINPTQEFREGFTIAGDDILKSVIEEHFLRPLQLQLADAGVANAAGLIEELFGEDRGGRSEALRNRRSHFANQIAVPFGLKMLSFYEEYDPQQPGGVHAVRFGDLFTSETMPSNSVIDYLDDAARRQGAVDFTVRDLTLSVDMRKVDHTVRNVIGPVLHALGEIVQLYDCDVLLLSGRPTRQPGTRAEILARLPLSVDRVVSMHRYVVGGWYPFRGRSRNEIDDPKTTTAVGALLCTLAQGQFDWFSFWSHKLKPKSTARFIGEMELSGQIMSSKVLFADVDLDGREPIEEERQFEFNTGILIGFRQLPVERWTATPFYRIAFSGQDAAARARGRTPYKVTLSFARKSDDQSSFTARGSGLGDLNEEGVFKIVDPVEDRDGGSVMRGDVELHLQTLRDDKGYWFDTGSFSTRE